MLKKHWRTQGPHFERRERGRKGTRSTHSQCLCIMTITIRFGSQAQRVVLLREEMREQGALTPHPQGAESSTGSPQKLLRQGNHVNK